MATPFLGEIKPFSFNFAPKGWTLCNGQLLPINQNQALFSLLGTFYGGNGVNNFALPNLQGNCVIGMGNGNVIGAVGGEVSHTLTTSELPAHNHPALASASTGNAASPISNYPAAATNNPYSAGTPSSPVTFASSLAGGGQPHENRQPFLVINFCIALQGIFPTRN
jgi:microcystin-dependent protein